MPRPRKTSKRLKSAITVFIKGVAKTATLIGKSLFRTDDGKLYKRHTVNDYEELSYREAEWTLRLDDDKTALLDLRAGNEKR